MVRCATTAHEKGQATQTGAIFTLGEGITRSTQVAPRQTSRESAGSSGRSDVWRRGRLAGGCPAVQRAARPKQPQPWYGKVHVPHAQIAERGHECYVFMMIPVGGDV